MIEWLTRAFSQRPERPPAPDREIFAVGDIHGCLKPLKRLLDAIEASRRTERPELIFLGDYVDRGPKSHQVIDMLIAGLPGWYTPVFLKGNHEATLVEFLSDPSVGPSWIQYGGGETLLSYGVRYPAFKEDHEGWAAASRELRLRLPKSHMRFLDGLQLFAERGPYFFAHAGVNPDRPLDDQRDGDLMWIREPFLDDTRLLERIIVHGHTPQEAPSADDRRIGLDLGGYQTGRLAAAHIMGEEVRLLTSAD